jgi:hypothetical protein
MRARSAHLGDQVSAYVDRALPAEVLARQDRHVVICQVCRSQVDDERRLLGYLRRTDTIGIPTSLSAALRELCPLPVPAQPVPLERSRRSHLGSRSPVRAALLAGLAASASAAAAWGIASPAVATAVAEPRPTAGRVAPGAARQPVRLAAGASPTALAAVHPVAWTQPLAALQPAWPSRSGGSGQVFRSVSSTTGSAPANALVLLVARDALRRLPPSSALQSTHARQSPHD